MHACPAKQLQQRHVPIRATHGFWASRRIGQAAQHRGKALVTLQHRAEGLRMAFPVSHTIHWSM